MNDKQIEWKVFQVHGDELETQLNQLSDRDYEIYSVQYTNPEWTIIVRKGISPEGKKIMGFGRG